MEDDKGTREPEQTGDGEQDLSDTPAPSVGPHTTFEKEDPEERLSRHEQSDVDAMGLDKRREVVGGSYSPSLARQLTMYGLFLLVVAALVVGVLVAINEFDQPPAKYADKAPWVGSEQEPEPLQ
jgi:hypothetical protein